MCCLIYTDYSSNKSKDSHISYVTSNTALAFCFFLHSSSSIAMFDAIVWRFIEGMKIKPYSQHRSHRSWIQAKIIRISCNWKTYTLSSFLFLSYLVSIVVIVLPLNGHPFHYQNLLYLRLIVWLHTFVYKLPWIGDVVKLQRKTRRWDIRKILIKIRHFSMHENDEMAGEKCRRERKRAFLRTVNGQRHFTFIDSCHIPGNQWQQQNHVKYSKWNLFLKRMEQKMKDRRKGNWVLIIRMFYVYVWFL